MSGCCGDDGGGRKPVRRTLAVLCTAGVIAGGLGIASHPVAAKASPPAGGDCCGGGGAAAAPAEGGHEHGAAGGQAKTAEVPAASKGLLVDLGNEKCPIMGGKPDGSTFSEWNGLRVGHCCPGCVKKFAADPAAALDGASIAWKDAAAAVKKANDAKTPEDRAAALKAIRAKWKVAREPEAPAAKPALRVALGNEK